MMKGLLTAVVLFAIATGAQAQQKKKALFVIVDGIAADVIEQQPTPNLDRIAKEGGFTRAHVGGEKGGYSQTPTISAVGYNSLLTGTWVNKHNVWDNDIAAPDYNYWTIFRFFKTQYPQKKTAIFSSWLDNRTKLVGEGLPATGGIQLDYHFDGLELDTLQYPHDKKKEYMHRIDEAVVNKAAEYIKQDAPDLSWVYLEYTDDMGHRYGDSPEFHEAIGYMDKQMGRLWDAISYRKKAFKEDWVIYITTDHGRDSATGKGHGGQSNRERSTWIVTNAKKLNNYFKTGNPGIVDIMPSIANFLGVTIPREQLMEVDGVPLSGNISATHPGAKLENGKIKVSWKSTGRKGNAKIWLTTTNQFKEGGRDQYVLKATVPLASETAEIDVTGIPSKFYKIVIETPEHYLNRWIVVK
ncbi:alkaline phosphatase family protein [Paraflavitalea sp. CAU 1676]|uniref:alkaline phosphatase family protein n=1 Tax=Paraflavitalea sp. CAU 1676 TaxID=3032598 RepID=UPI0023DAF3FE|nr:alkaline phosphatase family protein [Paraflavitalea sp. CAU 1676]MDF2193525.1 alkaline phosphatase family protein [Paraflavitalea sp. CAU 1676]